MIARKTTEGGTGKGHSKDEWSQMTRAVCFGCKNRDMMKGSGEGDDVITFSAQRFLMQSCHDIVGQTDAVVP